MIPVRGGLYTVYIFVIITTGITGATAKDENQPPVVTTKYGKVEGIWKVSYEGRQYAVFEGIPYAKPPIGSLRFEEPQPIEPWSGTWKATKINKCLQNSVFVGLNIIGEEDCLYLNIYVPKTNNESKKLDVVVHIHGGGFTVGHSSECTNEKYLMDRDIIFATMHYRLGALGFLSTEDEIVPGNNGLKDQTLAMRWIKANIDSFGGDANSITLTGFSAGAASVHLHFFSPLSQNLFNKAMSLSGTALNAFTIQESSRNRTRSLAKCLGCGTLNTTSMVDCLKKRPGHLIIRMTNEALHPFPAAPYCFFAPVVEKGSRRPFLSELPYKLLKQGKIQDVPWIASVTTHEGALFSMPLLGHYEDLNKNWTVLAKYVLQYDQTIPESKEIEIAEKIRNFYIPDRQAIDETKYEELTRMWTDRVISTDARLAAEMQSKVNKSPVYFYEFGYDSPHSLKTMFGKRNFTSVVHGDDMAYFFGGLIMQPLSADETKLKNTALDIIYSFAHNGKPSIPSVNWLPIGKDFYYLRINGPDDIEMQIKTNFTTEKFWRSLGLLENANLYPDVIKSEL